MAAHGDDFLLGESISCYSCGQRINIAEGYYTCHDICDFDLHPACYGGAC